MINTSGNKIFWIAWWGCVLTVVCIYSMTMDVAPFLHKDEFMIVDLGRIVLNPQTEWSITWLTSKDAPVLLGSYLGPVLQEMTYQTLGEFGPRISALTGAVAASVLMLKYLLVKGTTQNAAFVLSLVFFLDPLFVQGYSMGRVDGWAIAVCIGSCYVLANSKNSTMSVRQASYTAGALSIVAFFIWPSAVILFPLIVFELLLAHDSGSRLRVSVLPFILGCFICTIVIVLPIAPRILAQFSDMVDGLIVNLRYGSGASSSTLNDYLASFVEMLRVVKFSLALVLGAILSLILKKQTWLLIVTSIAASIILLTLVYIHRVMYLIPYLVLFVAALHRKTTTPVNNSKLHEFAAGRIPLIFLLIWSAGLSLGVRTALAFDGREERARSLVFDAANKMIGPGDFSVMSTNEFYYSGRALGWKMYSPYLAVGQPVSFLEMMKVLPHVDYVILQKHAINERVLKALTLQGFRVSRNYTMYDVAENQESGTNGNVKRIRNVYSIFPKPYGPYRLYVRRDQNYPLTHINNN